MKIPYRRLAGVLMAAFSAGSLLFTLYLLVQAWQVRSALQDRLLKGLDNTQVLLQSTADGLVGTRQVLSDTQGTLQALVDVSLAVASSAHEVPPILSNLEKLSGEELPETIGAAQVSLRSAQDSAGRIEAMLELVSQIPFFPGGRYEPEVSLKQALGQVAKDLEGVRTPLLGLQEGLKSSRTNLETLEVETVKLALELRKVSLDLEKVSQTLAASQQEITDLKTRAADLQRALPGWLERAFWMTTFLLVWLGLSQVAWLGISLRLV